MMENDGKGQPAVPHATGRLPLQLSFRLSFLPNRNLDASTVGAMAMHKCQHQFGTSKLYMWDSGCKGWPLEK